MNDTQPQLQQHINQLLASLPQLLVLGLAVGGMARAVSPMFSPSPRLLPHTRRGKATREEAEIDRLLGGSAERISWARSALRNVLSIYRRAKGEPFPWSTQITAAIQSLEAAEGRLHIRQALPLRTRGWGARCSHPSGQR